jgi:DNA repair protein RadC
MLPITREVATTYDGPTVACPSCHARIAIGPPTGWSIRSLQDVYSHLGVELAALAREELRVLLLNTKNVVLRVVTVYSGNVSASLVRVGGLFCEAVRDSVTSVVLAHNHPSGDPTSSPDDIRLTAEALAAGRLLDINVVDHLVVASSGYTSLRDRGVAFDR